MQPQYEQMATASGTRHHTAQAAHMHIASALYGVMALGSRCCVFVAFVNYCTSATHRQQQQQQPHTTARYPNVRGDMHEFKVQGQTFLVQTNSAQAVDVFFCPAPAFN